MNPTTSRVTGKLLARGEETVFSKNLVIVGSCTGPEYKIAPFDMEVNKMFLSLKHFVENIKPLRGEGFIFRKARTAVFGRLKSNRSSHHIPCSGSSFRCGP